MTDVIEMLAAASPDVDDEPVPSMDDVWRKLDDAAAGRSDARRSLRASGWWRRRRVMRWATVGVAAVAAAVAVLVVGTTGGGPTSAFAGWTPDPTHPAAGQLQAGESACLRDSSLASLTPTLTDTRGPYSAFLYAQVSTTTICVVGPPGRLTATRAAIILKGGAPSTSIAPGAIRTRAVFNWVTPTVEISLMTGQVGRHVTAVTLALDDGSKVEATTEKGWFAAWWPSVQGVKSADLTTTTGSTTQPIHVPTTLCKPRAFILARCKVGQ
jgi:hypothetical protein